MLPNWLTILKRYPHSCKRFYILLPILLLRITGSAQSPAEGQFFLQKLDNRSGLSNSAVNAVYKDEDELLWIGTWDGLNRYDGNTFHVFNYNREGNAGSIGNNVIRYITGDKRGNIWVSTIEGVSRFNKKTGRFVNYFYRPQEPGSIGEQEFKLAVDSAGTVYCLTQREGITRYNMARDTFETVDFPRHPSKVNKLAFDEYNQLWILGNTGDLEQFTVRNGQFERKAIWRDPKGISNFFLANGYLYYVNNNNLLLQIRAGEFFSRPQLTLKNAVTDMVYYKDHYLFAWSNRGFGVYDAQFRPAAFLQDEAQQMQQIRILSFAIGTQQILWYGTDGNGIIKVYPATKPFGAVATADNAMPYNRPVRAFTALNDQLWVGTKGSGIMVLEQFWDQPGGHWQRHYFSWPDQLDNNSVFALEQGRDGLVYIGTDGKGIGVYDTRSRRFHKWAQIANHARFPEFGSVYAIHQDKDSSVWLGTSGYGLVHLKLQRDGAGNLQVSEWQKYTFTNSDNGPANDIIYALSEGADGKLWIGCRYGGLSILDKATRKFRTFKAFAYEGSLSNNDILSVFHDSKGRVWIGTSYGLNWIRPEDLQSETPGFRKLTTTEGLPNNTIHAIEEDAAGFIWVSTNKGLARVQPDPLAITYYQQLDGLQNNEFSDGAVWKDAAGYLFMGGIDGFSYYLPRQITNTDWLPKLLVSDIRMGTEPQSPNSFAVLSPGGKDMLHYSLHRKDGFFELDIKAISFLNAEKCEYAYLLEGYDRIWRQGGNLGKIAYTNLPPGSYTLKLKWSNGEGGWTPETTAATIKVQQYWWLTSPALLVYAALLGWISYNIYRYRKNRREIRNQLAVEHLMRVREEELHQQRLGFFTNIAHELQTPLTLIMGSAERAKDKNAPYFMSLVHQQASRLTYLVQQLLEFRKAEAGMGSNQLSIQQISELLHQLADPFAPLAEQQHKQFERDIQPGILALMDKDKLEKIVFNLLSNAFKHSPRQASIRFSARENASAQELEICVANSGFQLPPDQLEKLFTSFYVAPESGSPSEKFGTGIGLAFTRQLVGMLNGRIAASSEQDWIYFKVWLPLSIDPAAAAENLVAISDKPSYLYRSITALHTTPLPQTAEENNKAAIIDNAGENGRRSILVVEDEPDIRYLLHDILKEQYIIYEAENGRAALELMDRISPDLIISDVMMPEMDGLEFCHLVKNTPATCQIPFIMLSAKGSIEHRTEGYESGADAYVAKPFHTNHLLVRIRKLLEYRQRMNAFFRDNSTLDLGGQDIPDEDKAFIDALVQLIEENLDDVELNAARLEKELALSKMQLYRKLKTISNMTPAEFIKNIRLRHAAHLLVSTSLTVSEIFFRTGFNNQSYFFREFKKRYQCAPNEYRAQQSEPL
ncbi:MAG: two-component regulator propeller domain-containing protein [Candidatus Pseudobacter hemicellulosilyticus]|uniref:histidine kinase n=1 Tax=Candidatus Pseudobacter hemicellulosilyticus TaxID=3121375 RepID=A0AAJ6BH57_9BACT|nr:MAG: two-component regulator propeller domain-containing protein [Pseudobacter sp.]